MVRGRRLLVAPLLAAAALALTACGSDYQYISNSQEQAFFRLPADMKVYRVQFQPSDRPARMVPGTGTPWQVVFDDADEPDPSHIAEEVPAEPVGRAIILPVGFQDAEGLSVEGARSYLAGFDPVRPPEPVQNQVELISYQDLSPAEGVVGSRVVYNLKVDDGSFVTRDQTSLIDIANRRIYMFEVKCASLCFKQARSRISEIVESWQVKP